MIEHLPVFYDPNLYIGSSGEWQLPTEEGRHAAKAMRLKVGLQLLISNGQGLRAETTIVDTSNFSCRVQINTIETTKAHQPAIHIGVAGPAHADRLEFMVEKLTELGVASITLLESARTERVGSKLERLQALAIAALKQSGQYYLPSIQFQTLDTYLHSKAENRYITSTSYAALTEVGNLPSAGGYHILIGPEGDFSERELALAHELGWQALSLGNIKLRTETAAVYAAAAIRSRFGT